MERKVLTRKCACLRKRTVSLTLDESCKEIKNSIAYANCRKRCLHELQYDLRRCRGFWFGLLQLSTLKPDPAVIQEIYSYYETLRGTECSFLWERRFSSGRNQKVRGEIVFSRGERLLLRWSGTPKRLPGELSVSSLGVTVTEGHNVRHGLSIDEAFGNVIPVVGNGAVFICALLFPLQGLYKDRQFISTVALRRKNRVLLHSAAREFCYSVRSDGWISLIVERFLITSGNVEERTLLARKK